MARTRMPAHRALLMGLIGFDGGAVSALDSAIGDGRKPRKTLLANDAEYVQMAKAA